MDERGRAPLLNGLFKERTSPVRNSAHILIKAFCWGARTIVNALEALLYQFNTAFGIAAEQEGRRRELQFTLVIFLYRIVEGMKVRLEVQGGSMLRRRKTVLHARGVNTEGADRILKEAFA